MDDYSFSVLKTYKSRDCLTLSQLSAIYNRSIFDVAEPVSYLRKQKLIRIESNYALLHELTEDSLIDPDTPLEITFVGKGALETEIKSRRHLTFNELRAWITLAIAVIALIVSIAALFK